MNHFGGLIILSFAIAAVFTLVTKESPRERVRYFLVLLAYMIAGSLAASWLMSLIP